MSSLSSHWAKSDDIALQTKLKLKETTQSTCENLTSDLENTHAISAATFHQNWGIFVPEQDRLSSHLFRSYCQPHVLNQLCWLRLSFYDKVHYHLSEKHKKKYKENTRSRQYIWLQTFQCDSHRTSVIFAPIISTYWSLNQMARIFRRYFQMQFFDEIIWFSNTIYGNIWKCCKTPIIKKWRLFRLMALHRTCDKSLPKRMMTKIHDAILCH